MQKIKFIVMAALIVSVLTACGMGKNTTKDNANENEPVENGVTNDNTENKDDPAVNDAGNDEGNGLDNGVDHNGESRMDHAEDAADKVAELDEVDNATVIITDNNAYVAVMMKSEGDNATDEALSSELEDKIADKVRGVKSDVKNVYVSLSPDFAERMRGYGERINEGEPIEGFFEEFGEAVRNVFPDAK